MPFAISRDKIKIWYDVSGEGEPLVLIGGSSLVHRQWDFVLPVLQGYYQVILYDQRGAGLSDRPSSRITVEHWVDDLRFILDEIGVRRTHVFATSNGSLVAIRFGAKYPEMTGAIIHYGIYKFTDQYKKMSRVCAKIIDEFGVGNGGLGAYFLARMFGAPPLYEEWVADRFEENLSPDAWKAMHKALDVDLTEDLRSIKSPQLILIGDRGPLGKDTDYASGWKEVQRLCPDVSLIVVKGAEGTFLPITHPAEVGKEVIGFLQKYRIRA